MAVIEYIIPALFVGLYLLIIIRFVMNKVAPVKSVEAKVIDKQKFTKEVVAKVYMGGTTERCVVTFLAGNKRLSFFVSEFSYDGYELGETGILKYRGNNIIDFEAE